MIPLNPESADQNRSGLPGLKRSVIAANCTFPICVSPLWQWQDKLSNQPIPMHGSTCTGAASNIRWLRTGLACGCERAPGLPKQRRSAADLVPEASMRGHHLIGHCRHRRDHLDLFFLTPRKHLATRQTQHRDLRIGARQRKPCPLFRTEHHAPDVGPINRARAHRTRLERGDQRAVSRMVGCPILCGVACKRALGVLHGVDAALGCPAPSHRRVASAMHRTGAFPSSSSGEPPHLPRADGAPVAPRSTWRRVGWEN